MLHILCPCKSVIVCKESCSRVFFRTPMSVSREIAIEGLNIGPVITENRGRVNI